MMQLDKKLLICLTIFAIFTLFSIFQPFHSSDEYGYMSAGREIASGSFAASGDAARFPLFPFVLSLLYTVLGYSELVTKLFVALLSFGTIILLYALVKEHLGENAAFVSTLAVASNPLFLYLGTRVLAEPLYMFLLVAAFYVIARFNGTVIQALVFGLLASALFLTRYEGALVGVAAVVYLYFAKKLSLITFRLLASFFVGALLILVPWLLFSNAVTGSPLGLALSFITHQVGLNEASTFSLPDRLPFYLIVLPFLLLAFTPFLWRVVQNYTRGVKKNKLNIIAAIVIAVFYAALEIYGFFNVALLRYIVPLVPILAIFAAADLPFKIKGIEINQRMLIILVGINLFAAGVVLGFFASYPKYVGYREAGQWAAENCQSMNSNIQKIIFHFSGKANSIPAQCTVVSSYDGKLDPAPGQQLVFESHGVKVYK